jgi:uncharacterized cupredoxin-like copper-binding protein
MSENLQSQVDFVVVNENQARLAALQVLLLGFKCARPGSTEFGMKIL